MRGCVVMQVDGSSSSEGIQGARPMNSYDICIVGGRGGRVRIARELARKRWMKPLRIIVLEQQSESGRKPAGEIAVCSIAASTNIRCSLKGRLAREGSALAVSYACRAGNPAAQTRGWSSPSRGTMSVEASGARRHRSVGCGSTPGRRTLRMRFVTPSGLRAWEPNLRACCGIIIPSVSVIDRSGLCAIPED